MKLTPSEDRVRRSVLEKREIRSLNSLEDSKNVFGRVFLLSIAQSSHRAFVSSLFAHVLTLLELSFGDRPLGE